MKQHYCMQLVIAKTLTCRSYIQIINSLESMRYSKWIGLLAAFLLIIACFIPWVYIESANITVSGLASEGTNYGKPAYFHFLLSVFFILFSLLNRIWATRSNLLITALNVGWALRNFFIITICQGGECPEKKFGIYLMLLSSIVMLITAMFPSMQIAAKENELEN